MKKTLIALAALASVSAFAQSSVTLSGKLRFGYESAKAADGAKSSGVGVTDGNVIFAATEDLGGGLKATASMDMRIRGRDAATDTLSGGSTTDGNGVRPRDASLTLSGNFGSVMVGAIEAGNGILGLVNAGGPTTYGLDNGTQLAAASNTDILKYTSPSFNGFTFAVATLDKVGANGQEAAATAQDATLVALSYANGPLSAAVDVTNYGANSATGTLADDRTRVSANYNLGVARVGFGYQTAKAVGGVAKKETAFGVNMPVGPWLLGAVYASSKTDGDAYSNTGYDLAAQYNLSKTTYVALQYQTTKAGGSTQGASASKYRVQLSKAF